MYVIVLKAVICNGSYITIYHTASVYSFQSVNNLTGLSVLFFLVCLFPLPCIV